MIVTPSTPIRRTHTMLKIQPFWLSFALMALSRSQRTLRRLSSSILLITILAPLFSLPSSAEYIPVERTSASTPRYEGVQVSYPAGRYLYQIHWQGIHVGQAEFAVSPPTEDGRVTLEARAWSGGIVKLFYSLKHVSQTNVNTKPFQPTRFSSRQIENSRPTYRLVEYGDGGLIKTRFWRPGKFDEHREFHSNNLTLDPLSAGLLAASIPLKENSTEKFDVFNGKHRFILTFTIPGTEEITVNKEKFTAWKAVPAVERLTDTKGENRLRSAVLWIDSKSKKIIKLESKVLIGHIRAELIQTLPFDAPPNPRGRLQNPEELPIDLPLDGVSDKK